MYMPVPGRRTMILTKQGRAWLAYLKQYWMIHTAGYPTPSPKKVRIDIKMQFPDKKRRDVSNYRKAIQDSMIGVFFEDDCQAWGLDHKPVIGDSWRLWVGWEDEKND